MSSPDNTSIDEVQPSVAEVTTSEVNVSSSGINEANLNYHTTIHIVLGCLNQTGIDVFFNKPIIKVYKIIKF